MRVESGGKFGLALVQSVLMCKISSRLHFDPSKHTFQDARLVRTISSCMLGAMKLLILEGVNACASWLNQALYCLFTIKFSFGFSFQKNFYISYVPGVQNVACIFLAPGLHLDRTSDNYGNYAFCCSSPGFLRKGLPVSVDYQTNSSRGAWITTKFPDF